MPPKATSITKSSKSATNKSGKAAEKNSATTPVQFVKGVGPRLGSVFESRGIRTVQDLLTFFPRTYEDRSQMKKVADLHEGESATLKLEILSSRTMAMRGASRFGGRTGLEARCKDESGVITLKWFYAPKGLSLKLKPGVRLIVTGTVKKYMNQIEMAHPECNWDADASPTEQQSEYGRIVPIYVELDGVPTKTLRKVLWNALESHAKYLPEDLPSWVTARYGFPDPAQAVAQIHFPKTIDPTKEVSPSHERLIYEELLKFEYFLLNKKRNQKTRHSMAISTETRAACERDLKSALPFSLTTGQQNALNEILHDLESGHPMNRLVQGDVGSGKTAVCLIAAGSMIASGSQVALMAPTEILAEQHYKTATQFFGRFFKTAFLTGRTPVSERRLLFERLERGEPLLLIGTHALLEDSVRFKSLDLVMIDEQHRFGVEQRRVLRDKGIRVESDGTTLEPHGLLLSATPIPRTLALTFYGDLSLSSIRELPPGRTPVKTTVISDHKRLFAMETIREELKAGRQAYFIFPLVNESEAEGFTHLKAATQEMEALQREVFPEFKVGLLHGQIDPKSKSQIMDDFVQNRIQILVSTTVIEVGVDVPNASIIAIEHAERFGLSQLHQLRGRVGRGKNASQCFLFSKSNAPLSLERLQILETTQDGFLIAEADLKMRGPGEFLGVRQSGSLPFKIADLVRDQLWLERARKDAEELLENDPSLVQIQNLPFKKYLARQGDRVSNL